MVFEDRVVLERQGVWDLAQRELAVPAGSVVVAFADEQGTDVSLSFASGDLRREVEDSRHGEGYEIAILDGAKAKAQLSLRGPANGDEPGSVRVRVEAFSAQQLEDDAVRARLDAYRAWSAATRKGLTAKDVIAHADADITRAIELLESGAGADAWLAASARAARARMYYEFEVDYPEALAEARRAETAFSAADVHDARQVAYARMLQAMSLKEMAFSSKETADTKKNALRDSRTLYKSLVSSGAGFGAVDQGRVYNDLGWIDLECQEWQSARRNYELAIGKYREGKFRSGEMQTLRNIARLKSRLGDYAAAGRDFTKAIESADLIVDDYQRASLFISAGLANINNGETDKAIERLLQAKSIAEKSQRLPPRARALQQLGLAYWARGDVEQARTFFDEALEAQQQMADDTGMFRALLSRGMLLRDSGDARAALDAHRRMLDHTNASLPRMRAEIEMARDYIALGDRPRALATIRSAVGEPLDAREHPTLLDARLTLAEVLVLSRARPDAETKEAVALAGDALERATEASDSQSEIVARRVLARVAIDRGERAEAVLELERAIELVSKYSLTSANPELQATARASQQQLFREYLDLQLADPAPDTAHQRALEVVERVRALNFMRTRGSEGTRRNARLDELLNELANRHIALAELREKEKLDENAIEIIQLDMATLRAQIDALRVAEATKEQRAGAEPVYGNWKPVAPGEAQLSYLLGTTRGYLCRRDAHGTVCWTLPGTAKDLRAAVLAMARIDRLQKPAAYDAALLALSQTLLPSGVVPADAPRVSIVADDELSLVPFAALRSPTDGKQRFAQTHVLAMYPSLLDTSPPKAGGARRWRLVAVRGAENAQGVVATLRGSPLFPALPGAGAEVDAVVAHFSKDPARVQVLDGARATRDGVRALMAQGADIVHFATHGLADLRHPLASSLSLPQGLLSAGQIQEWNGDVGLVFLSACETAVGPTRFAQGMPGLQRAFLRSGASNVIATLWPVEDRLAKEFAQDFYDELAKGAEPADALARAQRRWIESPGAGSSQKSLRRRVAAWGYVLYSR